MSLWISGAEKRQMWINWYQSQGHNFINEMIDSELSALTCILSDSRL
jgi:hypothetical protein